MLLKARYVAVLFLPIALHAELMYVQVKQSFLRSEPSFLSRPLLKVTYMQELQTKRVQKGWHFVTSPNSGIEGWVHSSAVSEEAFDLQPSEVVADTGVSRGEVLMAGKGFNQQVEDEYRKQHAGIDYAKVDELERKQLIERKELIEFAKRGKLAI